MRRQTIEVEFVESFPDPLAEGVLYVSMPYASAAHRCCCGCGNTVHSRLSPSDWSLTYDGRTVSLSPSIGNWNFPCRSHYWIRNNRVLWDRKWSDERIGALKRAEHSPESGTRKKRGFWSRLTGWMDDDND